MTDEVITALRTLGCVVEPCGSRVTCDPSPTDTDQDYLVQSKRDEASVAAVVDALSEHGFQWEGGEHYQMAMSSDFMSWRKGDVNFIVTSNPGFADRHRAATSVCKLLNLMDKKHRIALFQAVLYGNSMAGETIHPVKPAPMLGDDLPW